MNARVPGLAIRLPLAGHLLVSTSKCEDSVFRGSVCLIVHHGEEGSVGMLLNRSIDFDMRALWKHIQGEEAEAHEKPIRFGGPMSGPIVALHNQSQLAEAEAADGVYLAARLDRLQQLVASDSHEVRIVVGQAAWKAGQLEAELADGYWFPLPATPDIVFAPEEIMWQRGMREVGNRFVSAISGSSQHTSKAAWN